MHISMHIHVHSVLHIIHDWLGPINTCKDNERPAGWFDRDDAVIDDLGRVLIDQLYQIKDELEDENFIEGYADSDESESNELENEDEEI